MPCPKGGGTDEDTSNGLRPRHCAESRGGLAMKHMTQMAWAILVVGVLLAGTIGLAEAAGGRGGGSRWHGGGWHGGPRVFIGGGIGWWGWPGWWGPGWGGAPYPYYYPAPAVVAESAPSAYIQQAPAPPQQTYWYYCQNARAYYPYVQQCPGGWMQVVPPTGPPGP